MTSFLEYQRQGSNWTLDKIIGLTLNVTKYKPLRGSSFIPLPIRLRVKKAIVNVQNTDQKCFQWAILSALHPAAHHFQRILNYVPYADELDFTEIEFSVQMKDILKFEIQNVISVNVFGYEKGKMYPNHLTKQRFERHVDLVITSGQRSHYCWIKSLIDFYQTKITIATNISTAAIVYMALQKRNCWKNIDPTAECMELMEQKRP